jgi:hypothetical protein
VTLGVLAATAVVVVALGAFLVGRVTAPRAAVPSTGGTFLDGSRAGEAQGLQEGRALQAGTSVPAAQRRPVQDAFRAGYVAGANDVFGQNDGGWAIGPPYVITLERGAGEITYRVRGRELMQSGVAYLLCPDGQTVCQEPHR